MDETRQWAKTCNDCGGAVEFYCNDCCSPYCKECKDKHINSDEARHHSMSLYAERIEISGSCTEHHGQPIIAWCQTCDRAACGKCVTSTCGNGHQFKEILKKANETKNVLREKYEKTDALCSKWQNSLKEMDESKESLERNFELIKLRVKQQGSNLHREINRIEVSRLNHLQKCKDASLKELLKPKATIQDTIDTMKENINQYEDVLRSNDSIKVLQFKSIKADEEESLPPKLKQPKVPKFRRGKVDGKQLENMFGNVTSEERDLSYTNINGPTFSASQNVLKKTMSLPRSYTHTIPSKEETSVIHTGSSHASIIVCIGVGQAWVSTKNGKLELVDKSSNFEGTINSLTSFADATLCPSGELLLLNIKEKAVILLTEDKKLTFLFRMDRKPFAICALQNGNIIITFKDDRKVLKYDRSGKELAEFEINSLDYPFFVAENKCTGNIFVISKTGYGHYDYPGTVKAFKGNGDLLNEYTGNDDGEFTPVDLCSDASGNIYITDYVQSRIHILNKDGKFMRFLDVKGAELTKPCRMDINDSMYVWISENETQKIKVVRLN